MLVVNYVSLEIKIIAVKHSLVGTESLNQSAARFGVSRSTLQKWLLNYEMFGTEGLCHRAGNHHYSKEIKREAVEAYQDGVRRCLQCPARGCRAERRLFWASGNARAASRRRSERQQVKR